MQVLRLNSTIFIPLKGLHFAGPYKTYVCNKAMFGLDGYQGRGVGNKWNDKTGKMCDWDLCKRRDGMSMEGLIVSPL